MEEALYARLTAHAGLTALIATRVYPKQIPQGAALPAVVFERIAARRHHAMGADAGVATPRFRVTAWARAAAGKSAYENVKDVAAQVRAALSRFRGTVAGVVIQDVLLEGETDISEPNTEIQGVAQSYDVWHLE